MPGQAAGAPLVTQHSRAHTNVEAGAVDFAKRSAIDTCVYVQMPGESSKKMIVVRPGQTWQEFLENVSIKLDIQATRVFNTHDEITRISDLVQGDILFVKATTASSSHLSLAQQAH